jgi:DNA polymerase I-like protein with 3'-5' exonuclease and polymerase domains
LFGIHERGKDIPKLTRDLSKRLIYCVLYGGGAKKTGSIIAPKESEHKQYEKGKKTIDTFYQNLPAIKQLKDKVESTLSNRDYLIGIDGRHLQIRSKHSALNQLLQSTGAITVKKATTILYDELAIDSFRKSGEYFKLKCPLTGEAKIGKNWCETH